MQIIVYLIKHNKINKYEPIYMVRDQLDIPIADVQFTIEVMERNVQQNPVVSLAAINLLAEILQNDQ